MKIIFTLLLFNLGWVNAQEYIPLTDDDLAYDVEVIVFARNLSQPASVSIKTRSTDLDLVTKSLFINTEDLPLFKATAKVEPITNNESPNENTNKSSDENWQVPLGDDEVSMEALVWLFISQNMQHPIIERLNHNPIIKPLFHQKWRQPATEFLAPEYVSISSIKSDDKVLSEENENQQGFITDQFESDDFPFMDIPGFAVHPDFSFDGVVAFSKQRFTHFQVKMNYFRLDVENQQLIYSMDQKSRIELGQWQYFDHQQFGVLAKVVAVESKQTEEH